MPGLYPSVMKKLRAKETGIANDGSQIAFNDAEDAT